MMPFHEGSDRGPNAGAKAWKLQPVLDARVIALLVICALLLAASAQRLGLGRVLSDIAEFAGATIGLKASSSIGDGLAGVWSGMFPIVLDERTPIEDVTGLAGRLQSPLARLETVTVDVTRLDAETLEMVTVEAERTYIVETGGYALYVIAKMAETVEIAIWATWLAILISLPLAIVCARTFSPHLAVYAAARTLVSFLRSVPELISALFLVLALGFGPAAGIAALALHSIGFLAKFYAEDIEAADRRPQEAIAVTGAGRLAVLRLAVLPQVLPSYVALSLYILDRNIRMATVIGLVGAGGIGQELKGRYDMFQYDRVGTILLVVFITVLVLDTLSSRIRRGLI